MTNTAKPTMRLYTASVTIDIVVRAESPEHAAMIADREWVNEIVGFEDFIVTPMRVLPIADSADKYNVYGDHDHDLTIAECVAAGEAPEYAAALERSKRVNARLCMTACQLERLIADASEQLVELHDGSPE